MRDQEDEGSLRAVEQQELLKRQEMEQAEKELRAEKEQVDKVK